jgi:hypothetical protein
MKELLTALQGAAIAVGYVQKKGRNDFQNYNYVTEADVVAQTRKALLEHDIVIIPSVSDVSHDEYGNTNILVVYTVYHTPSGENLTFTMAGAGNDRNSKGVGDKGIYKALTGCNKYALLKALQLATGDDPEVETADKDAAQTAPKAAPATQKPELKAIPKPEVKDNPKPWVIEPSKIDKSKFVNEVRDIVKGFIDATTDYNNLTKFYTINRETWKLLESMDAAAAKQIVEDFKVRSNELKGDD